MPIVGGGKDGRNQLYVMDVDVRNSSFIYGHAPDGGVLHFVGAEDVDK